MTTWDMATVGKVQRLYVEVHIDLLMVERGAMPVAREEAAKALAREAEALAVDVHVGDVAFEEIQPTEDGERYTIRIVAHWKPRTREVELRGGPVDGTVVEVQKPGDSIRIATPQTIDWRNPPEEPATLTEHAQVFELSGWDEQGRRWIYAPSATRRS